MSKLHVKFLKLAAKVPFEYRWFWNQRWWSQDEDEDLDGPLDRFEVRDATERVVVHVSETNGRRNEVKIADIPLYGNIVLNDVDLTGANLSGLDLRRIDFFGCDLERVNFRDSLLGNDKPSTRITNCNLTFADFSYATLKYMDITGVCSGEETAINLYAADISHSLINPGNGHHWMDTTHAIEHKSRLHFRFVPNSDMDEKLQADFQYVVFDLDYLNATDIKLFLREFVGEWSNFYRKNRLFLVGTIGVEDNLLVVLSWPPHGNFGSHWPETVNKDVCQLFHLVCKTRVHGAAKQLISNYLTKKPSFTFLSEACNSVYSYIFDDLAVDEFAKALWTLIHTYEMDQPLPPRTELTLEFLQPFLLMLADENFIDLAENADVTRICRQLISTLRESKNRTRSKSSIIYQFLIEHPAIEEVFTDSEGIADLMLLESDDVKS